MCIKLKNILTRCYSTLIKNYNRCKLVKFKFSALQKLLLDEKSIISLKTGSSQNSPLHICQLKDSKAGADFKKSRKEANKKYTSLVPKPNTAERYRIAFSGLRVVCIMCPYVAMLVSFSLQAKRCNWRSAQCVGVRLLGNK